MLKSNLNHSIKYENALHTISHNSFDLGDLFYLRSQTKPGKSPIDWQWISTEYYSCNTLLAMTFVNCQQILIQMYSNGFFRNNANGMLLIKCITLNLKLVHVPRHACNCNSHAISRICFSLEVVQMKIHQVTKDSTPENQKKQFIKEE